MKFKNVLFIFTTVIMVMFSAQACDSRLTSSEINALDGKVKIVDMWGGHGRKTNAWRNITLVIANPTNKNRKIRALCSFKSDGALFGEKIVMVRAGFKTKTMIRGFARSENLRNTLTCELKPTR